MDTEKTSHDLLEPENELEEGEQQTGNGPKVDGKPMKTLILGLVILIFGVALAAIMFLSFSRFRPLSSW